MKIECEKCHTEYNFDASLIRQRGSRFRCAKCSHVFRVYPSVSIMEKAPAEKIGDAGPAKKRETTSSDETPFFRIVAENNCPLYGTGDEFHLAGKTFFPPPKKAPCLILVRDVIKIVSELPNITGESVFNCSGCTGLIRFGYKSGNEASPDKKNGDYIDVVARSLSKIPIFQTLEKDLAEKFTSYLKFDEFATGDIIIRKGDPGRNLYIIISGRIEVVGDDEMSLAFLEKGDVFGEMSLLSGNPVGATIKVMRPSTILYIVAKDFRSMLSSSPSLQMYFTRLLAGRMAEINTARAEEFASGMAGKLSEMPPSELFQTFNMNQKTGVLTLKMAEITAYLSFRDGNLISVRYGGKDGQEAFFELLKLKRGRFKFIPGLSPEEMKAPQVGDFMHLLMEGLKRIDEDDRRFIRTVIPSLT